MNLAIIHNENVNVQKTFALINTRNKKKFIFQKIFIKIPSKNQITRNLSQNNVQDFGAEN